MANSAESYVPNLPPMHSGWPTAKSMSHFNYDDITSPPMSHLGTPTEDFCPPNDALVQPVSHNTCSSLQMPIMSTITSVTPPVQPVTPPVTFQHSMLSTSPQRSLAIKQFKVSTLSDTPTPSPSSNDEEYSAASPMSDKQSLSEFNEDLGLCKSKQEILKLIPKDVRVPQSKYYITTIKYNQEYSVTKST